MSLTVSISSPSANASHDYYLKPTNNEWYSGLSWKSSLKSNDSGSVTIYSKTKNSLLVPGNFVCISEGSNYIYIGYISEVDDVENNYYYGTTTTRYVTNVSFTSAINFLNYISPTEPKQYISKTVSYIIKDVLGTYAGDISDKEVYMSITFSGSVLYTLKSITNQCGWRYRCRPTGKTSFVIDCAPSFMEDTKLSLVSNYSAMNLDASDTNNLSYGSVSSSSRDVDGTIVTSTIPLITKHNDNYTADKTTYVVESYDDDIKRWEYVFQPETYLANFETKTNDKQNTYRANITIYADSNSDTSLYLWYPKLVFMVDNTIYEESIYSSANFTKVKFTTEQSSSGASPQIVITADIIQDSIVYKALLDKGSFNMIALRNSHYRVDKRDDIPSSGSGYLGGEKIDFNYSNGILEVINRTTKGYITHKQGCLFTYTTTIDSESPYALYKEQTYCANIGNGFSPSYVDYMVSKLAIFRSNFDANGSCNVPRKYIDLKTVKVGDRIKITTTRTGDVTEYELLSYSYSVTSGIVSITFGTNIYELFDTLESISMRSTPSIM